MRFKAYMLGDTKSYWWFAILPVGDGDMCYWLEWVWMEEVFRNWQGYCFWQTTRVVGREERLAELETDLEE